MSVTYKRESNIELLRIMAMVLIVLSHLVTHGGFLESKNVSLIVLAYLLRLGGKLGVTCFVLISGYYLSHSKFKIKNVIKLYLQIVFFAVLCYLIKVLISGNVGVGEAFKTLFAPIYGIYWFPTAYLGLYICFPFLNIVISKLDKDLIKADIIFTVAFSIVNMCLPTSDFLINNFLWFVYLYFLGATIHGIEKYRYYSKDFIIFLLCILVMWTSSLVCLLIGTRSGISVLIDKAFYFSKMESPIMVFAGVTLFRMMLNKGIKENRVINRLGGITFAVYLLHDNDITRAFMWNIIYKTQKYCDSTVLEFMTYAIFVVVSLFFLAFIVELPRKMIESSIMSSRLMCRIADRVDKWYPS